MLAMNAMNAMNAMDASRADERSTENEGDDEGWAARRVMNGWIDGNHRAANCMRSASERQSGSGFGCGLAQQRNNV